ncbi:hypothetical protein SS50377_25352 [Spironucleus salmonicida]|uniref:Uncharacterized protein n=1 Tax=Spironucleus salmonicida TaxID=348837 RepID=V6LDM1_9EUKA|nr:hypothetical protein SS50377_25352 [Spironucleus salmonicida]|eukprot:EST41771.1 Hypothetical protein SS50377_18604 [Spironucleus salmonicida]
MKPIPQKLAQRSSIILTESINENNEVNTHGSRIQQLFVNFTNHSKPVYKQNKILEQKIKKIIFKPTEIQSTKQDVKVIQEVILSDNTELNKSVTVNNLTLGILNETQQVNKIKQNYTDMKIFDRQQQSMPVQIQMEPEHLQDTENINLQQNGSDDFDNAASMNDLTYGIIRQVHVIAQQINQEKLKTNMQQLDDTLHAESDTIIMAEYKINTDNQNETLQKVCYQPNSVILCSQTLILEQDSIIQTKPTLEKTIETEDDVLYVHQYDNTDDFDDEPEVDVTIKEGKQLEDSLSLTQTVYMQTLTKQNIDCLEISPNTQQLNVLTSPYQYLEQTDENKQTLNNSLHQEEHSEDDVIQEEDFMEFGTSQKLIPGVMLECIDTKNKRPLTGNLRKSFEEILKQKQQPQSANNITRK